ncbi:MAG: DNA replication/repair protein RecF [Clostridiales bacterium]|jgi:DNA replication and repair protein RecF|nr:DNA replication/repair protein RecF [Clostridiales bacterium]
MYIDALRLKDFRNYAAEDAVFFEGLNIFKGSNASGKTNLLEAVYVCGVGKSLRTNQDKEMVRWDVPEASVKLTLVKKYGKHDIEIFIDSKGKKRVLIDGIAQVRMAELLGYLNIVFFSPDELKLIKEGPSERRRFMDISLCQQSRLYLKSLSAYNKALTQRNKILKTAYNAETVRNMLDVFDVQLAKYGAPIIEIRKRFVANISQTAAEWHSKISGGTESLSIAYESPIADDGLTAREITDVLIRKYAKDRERDTETQFTNSGPHRDDLKVIVNGVDIRKFGSQGQQRSAALSLKLAEIESFRIETGETPVLLLDDVLSELDLARQKNLLDATKGIQTILTCTHFDIGTDVGYREYIVTEGKIVGQTDIYKE